MKSPTLALVVLSGSLLFGSSGLSNAQVLLNGGFEDPALNGAVSAVGAGSTWQASVATSAISVYADGSTSNGIGNTPYGTQFLTLSGGTSISQAISGFTSGDDYVLGVDFANYNSAPGSEITITISGAAGSATETLAVPTGGPSTGTSMIPFDSGVLFFVPTATGTNAATVTITDPVSGSDLAIDNIALYGFPTGTSIPNNVPEPSTWALMLGGLSGLALWQLRRRRA